MSKFKITSQAPSDLFFPTNADGTEGITLPRMVQTEFDTATLHPHIFRRFRIMAEDKQALIESEEAILPVDGLPLIPATAPPPRPPEPQAEPQHEPERSHEARMSDSRSQQKK